jgi:4-amino-4-deoxy-L-arabinose transferase-like glycosyltransferase
MDLNSLSPDESQYIYIGKTILNGGYPYNFMHRLPLIPSLFSLFFSAGFSVHTARLLIPVIFMNSALVMTYLFAKTLYTKKEAIIATSVLFSFPFFWKWGLNVLVDIPLITFSLLFLLFFYLGTEKENKYWFLSAIFLALALLVKQSAILLIPPAFLYLLITKKWKLMLTKEFILSAVFVPLFLICIYAFFHVLTSASINIASEIQKELPTIIKHVEVHEIPQLLLAPILIFGIFGLSKRKEDIFMCLTTLSFVIFFLLGGHLKLRYWAPILPLLAIFVASGYIRLKERVIASKPKKLISLIFVVLLLLTFVNAIYTANRAEGEYWGAEKLSEYVVSLDGNIATEYRPGYLNAPTVQKANIGVQKSCQNMLSRLMVTLQLSTDLAT